MLPRARAAVLAGVLALGPLLAGGCSADDGPRPMGDAVTAGEARVLAGLLHQNFRDGGADFVVTAPYGQAVLRLTGTIDFRDSVGRAEAVTSFSGDRPDDVRTVFFTGKDLWVGDMPALSKALAADHAPSATFLRRPLAAADDEEPPLLDAIVGMLLRLADRSVGDPAAFLVEHRYTWDGQRSIDSRLTSLFRLPSATVAVDAGDDRLVQYSALVGSAVDVTITLADHGPREVKVPSGRESALVADHQKIAAALGV